MVKDREGWRAAVHRVAKSQTQLSDRETTKSGKLKPSQTGASGTLLAGPPKNCCFPHSLQPAEGVKVHKST